MQKDQYDILLRKINSLQTSVDTLLSDLAVDRKDIDDLKLRQIQVEQTQKLILEKLRTFEDRQKNVIENSVNNAVEENIQPMQNILTKFVKNKSKVVVMKERFNLIKSIGRLFRSTKNEIKKEMNGGE